VIRRVLIALVFAMPLFAHEGLHEQIADVTRQLVKDPDNAALHLKRGELHRLHGAWDFAASDYDRAERLDAKLDAVQLARGTMLLDSGRAIAAIAPLRRYLAAHPDDPRGRIALGRALVKSGRPAEGAAELAVGSDPDLALERAAALVAAKQPEAAVRSLDAMMQRLGAIVTLQLGAIDIEIEAGHYDAALQRIDVAAQTSIRKETWLARRGDVLVKAGRPAEAQRAYEAALAAIATLPATRRRTRAVSELERRLQQQLDALR
jgi:predicted Zn-dependent protease